MRQCPFVYPLSSPFLPLGGVAHRCGLVDGSIRRLVRPLLRHTVVEPHPDVLQRALPWAAGHCSGGGSGDEGGKDDGGDDGDDGDCDEGGGLQRPGWVAGCGGGGGGAEHSKCFAGASGASAEARPPNSSGPQSSQSPLAAAEVRAARWQEALPALLVEEQQRLVASAAAAQEVSEGTATPAGVPPAAGRATVGFDSIFYDTHDEGVGEFLAAARAAAALLKLAPAAHHRPRRQFSFWNGSEHAPTLMLLCSVLSLDCGEEEGGGRLFDYLSAMGRLPGCPHLGTTLVLTPPP